MRKRVIDYDKLWDLLNKEYDELNAKLSELKEDDYYMKSKCYSQQLLILDLRFYLIMNYKYANVDEE